MRGLAIGVLLGAVGAVHAAPELKAPVVAAIDPAAEPRPFMLSDRLAEEPDALWPRMPEEHALSMDDRMADNLSGWTNRVIGGHLDKMSHDLIGLSVDARRGRAHLRVGVGDGRYLKFKFDSNWLFVDGKAKMNAKLDIGVSGHMFHLDVPEMDVWTDSYHGQDLVQVNVPLLQRRW